RCDPVLPSADVQRPDPGRGGHAAVRRRRLSPQGRVRRGSGVRTGAGRDRPLDPLRRREEARGVPREERAAPWHRCRRRTGLPRPDPGEPAAGTGTCTVGAVPGDARNRARGVHGRLIPASRRLVDAATMPAPQLTNMAGTLRRHPWLTALAVLLLALAVLVALWDWNWFKGPIERQVQARTGRTLDIGGDLDVDLGRVTRISAERVRFGNADWSDEKDMASTDRIEFAVRVWPLLQRKLIVPDIHLSKPELRLE